MATPQAYLTVQILQSDGTSYVPAYYPLPSYAKGLAQSEAHALFRADLDAELKLVNQIPGCIDNEELIPIDLQIVTDYGAVTKNPVKLGGIVLDRQTPIVDFFTYILASVQQDEDNQNTVLISSEEIIALNWPYIKNRILRDHTREIVAAEWDYIAERVVSEKSRQIIDNQKDYLLQLVKDAGCCGGADPSPTPIQPPISLTILAHYQQVSQGATNRAPILFSPMPDIDIKTSGAKTFALPDREFIDPDDDTLTTVVAQTNGQALPNGVLYNTSTRTFTVAESYNGSVAIRVVATDPGNLSSVDEFLLTVSRPTAPAVNHAPTLIDPMPDVYRTESGILYFALPDNQFTDPDGETLIATVAQVNGDALPTGVSYNTSTRTFAVEASYSGSFPIRVTATDPGGLSATDDFLLTVDRQTAGGRPPGTESCANYTKLSNEQYQGLTQITIFEYKLEQSAANGASARAFASQTEATTQIQFIPSSVSRANFDFVRVSSSDVKVGDILYGNNQTVDGNFQNWPAEGGYWGYALVYGNGNENAPTGYTLLQTNACGEIITKTPITF